MVCERVEVASTRGARTKGFLGRDGLEPGEGLLIEHTGSVHTAFMRFPMDAVFIDKQMCVRRIVPDIPPFRIAWARRARRVLELPAGEAARVGLQEGSRLEWRDREGGGS